MTSAYHPNTLCVTFGYTVIESSAHDNHAHIYKGSQCATPTGSGPEICTFRQRKVDIEQPLQAQSPSPQVCGTSQYLIKPPTYKFVLYHVENAVQ